MRILKLGLGAMLLMAIVAAGFAHADVNLAGTTAAGFLSNGSGPRVLSMGGATLALGGDMQAAAWNPAALGSMQRGELALSHAGLPGDMQQEWLGFGGRFGHSSTRWGVQGLYQGNGSFDGRDASNNPTGSFSAASFAVGGQLAQSFGERATIGVGGKFVNEKLGDVTGSGMTFDFGGQLRAGGLGFGAAATNVGGQMRYSNAIYGFPTSYGAGVSYTLPVSGISLAVDANFPKSYYNDVRFGAEWRFRDVLALRAGYRSELSQGTEDGLSGPTFGLGAGYNGLRFDYGYLVSSVSGGSEQRLAVSFHPGGFGLGGASLGSNGTGASHAPGGAAFQSSPAPLAASEKAKPAKQPAAAKSSAKSTPAPPVVRSNAMTAMAPDDAKPSTTKSGGSAASLPASAPAVVSNPTADKPAVAEPAAPVEKAVEKRASDDKPAEKPAVTSAAVVAPPARVEAPPAAAVQPAPKRAPKPAAVASAPVADETSERPESVTVKKGDTIAAIARRFGTSIPAIMMENNMVSEKITVGQKLKLPKAQ